MLLLKAYNEVLRRILQKEIATFKSSGTKRALVYNKTNSLVPGYIQTYEHTNLWEVVAIKNILVDLGYTVDVVDRGPIESQLANHYDLILSAGCSDSSSDYARLCQQYPQAQKILYTLTATPTLFNRRVHQRYRDFNTFNQTNLEPKRLVTSFNETTSLRHTDVIITPSGDDANSSYAKYNLPTFPVNFSTAPFAKFRPRYHRSRQPHNFLFFAGAGNILKGLDIAIEAFHKTPSLNLYVVTDIEPEIHETCRDLIENSPNIKLIGRLFLNSDKFQRLISRTTFAIFPTCTEGKSTSLLTCMRYGLIPIATKASGLNVSKFGYALKDLKPETLHQVCDTASQLSRDKIKYLTKETLIAAGPYTQANFKKTMREAIMNACHITPSSGS